MPTQTCVFSTARLNTENDERLTDYKRKVTAMQDQLKESEANNNKLQEQIVQSKEEVYNQRTAVLPSNVVAHIDDEILSLKGCKFVNILVSDFVPTRHRATRV